MDELCYLRARDALDAFASRTLSPVELLDAVLARADTVEPTLNAITSRRMVAVLAPTAPPNCC